jgi:YVTN family beta-propeller protein
MLKKTFARATRKKSTTQRLVPLAGLAAIGLSATAFAQSSPFPTYKVGENTKAPTGPTYTHPLANPWVVSDGTILTPAGTQVYLGIATRAKAVALNPTGNHTAAVLQMGAPQAVTIFNTQTGAIVQTYSVPYTTSKGAASTDSDGSQSGITYSPDGKYLLFSQDGNYGPSSFVAIASVDAATGKLTNYAQVNVPIDVNEIGKLTNVTCTTPYNDAVTPATGSPAGTTGSFAIPCGFPYSIFTYDTFTSYPTGIAVTPDSKTAYAVLNANDTLAKIDLTAAKPVEGLQVRVGQVPNSVVISPDGKTAYVSNEAGPIPGASDFQQYSDGTPVAAEYPTGTTVAGTISVVDLGSFAVTSTITVGHHPTGMAFWGNKLVVANTYDDTLSVIDPTTNTVERTIYLGPPIPGMPALQPTFGLGPNSIAVDAAKNIAYVACYNANAIAVVDLNSTHSTPVGSTAIAGAIPVGYAPSSVVLDKADNALLVANDKGIGTTGYGVDTAAPTNTYENSFGTTHGVTYFNTHQDLGTVSIVPIPDGQTLFAYSQQVLKNNHWDLAQNLLSTVGANPSAAPVAIPAKIGEPSKIKHVFLIIRENRTYDQMLGDVSGGNGDPSLAVFGDHSTYAQYPVVTPNAHTLVQRFPLLDNFYDPSRQSADGHNWILQAMAPYSDDIQSPDWLRDYPSNGGDAIAYQKRGNLFDIATAAGIKIKNYGEYIEYNTFTVPGCTPAPMTQDSTYNGTVPPTPLPFVVTDSCEPTWTQFYNDTLEYESGKESQLKYYNSIKSYSALPNVMKSAVQNYPQFDLGIPDQYRVDVWKQDFDNDVANGTVPQLSFLWIMQDHTTGPPNATAEQADNDLAVGRVIDTISHSAVWKDSAIFVEEDDAQDGVDHVDGHRSPGYVVSPYVTQKVDSKGNGTDVQEASTFYTQVNMTRTIEQILGLKPMNQNDLVASPMTTLFVDNPPANNFLPWNHVPNQVPLCYGVAGYVAPSDVPASLNTCSSTTMSMLQDSPQVKSLRNGWMKMKAQVFAAKYHVPDSLDPDTVSHFDWYEATGFKVAYPGEKKVRPASDFKRAVKTTKDLDD